MVIIVRVYFSLVWWKCNCLNTHAEMVKEGVGVSSRHILEKQRQQTHPKEHGCLFFQISWGSIRVHCFFKTRILRTWSTEKDRGMHKILILWTMHTETCLLFVCLLFSVHRAHWLVFSLRALLFDWPSWNVVSQIKLFFSHFSSIIWVSMNSFAIVKKADGLITIPVTQRHRQGNGFELEAN